MSTSMPSNGLGLSAAIIIYSTVCLFLSLLLFYLLWDSENGLGYGALVGAFTSLATCASIAQQIHYAVDWKTIRLAQVAAQSSPPTSDIIVTGNSQGADVWLFWIQYYSYNVEALLVLFWAVQLFKSTWGYISKNAWLPEYKFQLYSKIFSVIFPSLTLGIARVPAILDRPFLFLAIVDSLIAIGIIAGSTVLSLTLHKFLQSRRIMEQCSNSTRDTTPKTSHTTTITGADFPGVLAEHRQLSAERSDDIWLVIRFTIGFIVLAAFFLLTIVYQVISFRSAGGLAPEDPTQIATDTKSIIGPILGFLPGVTGSLASFLVWGTTKPLRRRTTSMVCCATNRRFGQRSSRMPKHRSTGSILRTRHSAEDSVGDFQRLEEGSIGTRGLDECRIQVTKELTVHREEPSADFTSNHQSGYELENWKMPPPRNH